VNLEVLDWGGTGRPIVFVGCYLSGHVYDDIAPKLTDQFHVYAVTRRGVGNSDRPLTGYDPQRRAADMRAPRHRDQSFRRIVITCSTPS
jgi:pimeloyl-ACP methyl ester carboxylesterase